MVAADGTTYERKAIEDWFTRSSDSPLMGALNFEFAQVMLPPTFLYVSLHVVAVACCMPCVCWHSSDPPLVA